jgi:hypothetical protein
MTSYSLIKKENDGLSKHFKCDDVGELEDYVGCKIEIDRSQPVLVQSLFDEFADIEQGRLLMTHAQMHKRYRSGVGKLMYLAKHTRPDISNTVRDLARHMHEPNEGHWKALHKICQIYKR